MRGCIELTCSATTARTPHPACWRTPPSPARGEGRVSSLAIAMEAPMEIKRSGSEPSRSGPADWFTGSVRIDRLFDLPEPARAAAALVTFEPGARTNWHTHPFGQTVIVTAGLGWAQREGGPIEEIRPGDVV